MVTIETLPNKLIKTGKNNNFKKFKIVKLI